VIKINFLSISKDWVQLLGENKLKSIRYINIHFYRPGETHTVHRHEDREEIFIGFQGKGKVITGKKEIDVTRGDILLFGVNEEHGFIADEEEPFAYLCIGLNIP